jgi:prevent-host-death family protein
MKTASAAKVAAQFQEYLEASREQPVLVTRDGKPVAVLLAVQDKAEAEQLACRHSRSLRSIFEEAHEQIRTSGGIVHDQFWREVEQSRRAEQPAPPSSGERAEQAVAADRGPTRQPRSAKSRKGRGR